MFIHSGGGMDREESESSITDRVYRWCLKDPLYRLPIKGASKPFDEHLRWRDISYQPPGQQRSPYTVRLHFLDPIYWRDLLSSYVRGQLQVANPATGEVFAVEQWLLNDHNDEDYNRHLSAVQKVRIKKGRSFVEKYTTKTSGAPHDYHDLAAYQLARAHGPARCFAMPTPEHLARQSAPPLHQTRRTGCHSLGNAVAAPSERWIVAGSLPLALPAKSDQQESRRWSCARCPKGLGTTLYD